MRRSPLPIPRLDWLRTANERYRAQDMPPAQRPFRALKEWAAENGATEPFLIFLDTEAWREIDAFFRKNTKLGQERAQPLGRSVWFYDGSFHQVNLPTILGGAGPSTKINPFQLLATSMPSSLLHDFSRDEGEVTLYLEHLANAVDSHQFVGRIAQDLSNEVAKKFLKTAEQHLDSAVASLLDTPPNPVAAHLCRLAFESSLKALLAEKGNLSESDAIQISHRLDKLVAEVVAMVPSLVPMEDLTRITKVADDSVAAITVRQIFPDFGARYEGIIRPGRRLWHAYAAAVHAFATTLRSLGASDSRSLN